MILTEIYYHVQPPIYLIAALNLKIMSWYTIFCLSFDGCIRMDFILHITNPITKECASATAAMIMATDIRV